MQRSVRWGLVVCLSLVSIAAIAKGRAKTPKTPEPPPLQLSTDQRHNAQQLFHTICGRLADCRPDLKIVRSDCEQPLRENDPFYRTVPASALDAAPKDLSRCIKGIGRASCEQFLSSKAPKGCEIFQQQ
ncbi:MAG: hypothetical protein HY696_07520 [Deltaproteobacteria bacterium]|nr:hypothetical protein [Deltaproteobacteria bacterium]